MDKSKGGDGVATKSHNNNSSIDTNNVKNKDDDYDLKEKEKNFVEAEALGKVADMMTFGLYGDITGIREVSKALHEEQEKGNEEGRPLTAGHAAYVAANAWTDGGVEIAEKIYEKKKREWKEKHNHNHNKDDGDGGGIFHDKTVPGT